MSDNEIKIKASIEDDASDGLQKVGNSVEILSKTTKKTTTTVNDTAKSFTKLTNETKKTDNSFASIKERADIATTSLKGLVLEGVHLAVESFKKLGKQVVDAFKGLAEGEAATNRLTTALKNQGIYSGYLIRDYKNFAKELRNYSGISDDIIKDNMTLLTTYGLMGDELKRATNAAMTLSVGLGTNLKSATMMLARAAEGNTKTFAGYGITIKDTGDKAKNFQEILKGVEDKFGDLAKVNADNLNTQIAVLKENWNDFVENIAGSLVPVVNWALGKFKDYFNAIEIMENKGMVADWIDEATEAQERLNRKKDELNNLQEKYNRSLENRIPEFHIRENENAIKLKQEEINAEEELIKRLYQKIDGYNTAMSSEKKASEEAIANRQKELKAIKAKAEAEQKADEKKADEKKASEEAELKWKEELEKKKMDLQISSQQSVINNIADLNKSANDYELAEKINYYEKDYQAKIDSLNRQIQAIQTAGNVDLHQMQMLYEQKETLDEEYQKFIDERNEIIKEKGTVLHDFNVWLSKDETQNKINDLKGLASAQTSNIKALQIAGKAAAITTATIDTYVAATRALADFPVPISYVIAAAVTAQGLENVAKIAGISFAVGTDYIPQDMVATVHQGEIIVPRTFSDALRSGDIALSSPDYNLEEETNNNQSSSNNQTIIINVENNGNSIDELAETIRDVIAKNIAIGTIKPFPTKERM